MSLKEVLLTDFSSVNTPLSFISVFGSSEAFYLSCLLSIDLKNAEKEGFKVRRKRLQNMCGFTPYQQKKYLRKLQEKKVLEYTSKGRVFLECKIRYSKLQSIFPLLNLNTLKGTNNV